MHRPAYMRLPFIRFFMTQRSLDQFHPSNHLPALSLSLSLSLYIYIYIYKGIHSMLSLYFFKLYFTIHLKW